MKLSWLEKKKASVSVLLTSLLNLPCSLPHTLNTSCSNTYTLCIWFVVYLLPPDFKCCGLLLHCYYGIVSGCDENRHKQWWELNENKETCISAKKNPHTHKKQTKKGCADLCFFVSFSQTHFFCAVTAHTGYVFSAVEHITLFCTLLCRFKQTKTIQEFQEGTAPSQEIACHITPCKTATCHFSTCMDWTQEI